MKFPLLLIILSTVLQAAGPSGDWFTERMTRDGHFQRVYAMVDDTTFFMILEKFSTDRSEIISYEEVEGICEPDGASRYRFRVREYRINGEASGRRGTIIVRVETGEACLSYKKLLEFHMWCMTRGEGSVPLTDAAAP